MATAILERPTLTEPVLTEPVPTEVVLTEVESFVPPAPQSIEDTGLPTSLFEQLIVKLLHSRGDMLGRDLSEAMGLKFSLIEGFIDFFKRQHVIQAKKSLGMGDSTSLFSLSEAGRELARTALENNQYMGPAPVPLYQYTYIVRRQQRTEGWLTPEVLSNAYSRMVVTPRILSQVGPAVSSGNSFLIYGQPGNGKTFLAEALQDVEESCFLIP